MTPAVAPPSTRSTHQELRLRLELERASDSALLRVVSTLHRRRCRILHVAFEQGTDACELAMRVLAPRPSAACVEHWLRGLVDVRAATALPAETCERRYESAGR